MKMLTLSLLALATAGAGCAHAQTLADAERMIDSCLSLAAKQKFPPFSVGVIDASGALVAFRRQDGASAATADAALLKARTALKVNAPTSVIAPAVGNDQPTRDAFLVMQLTMLPGGVPLADRSGKAIGAVAVSGGTAEQDTQCADRAAEAFTKGR